MLVCCDEGLQCKKCQLTVSVETVTDASNQWNKTPIAVDYIDSYQITTYFGKG